jgi:hypothetical protein
VTFKLYYLTHSTEKMIIKMCCYYVCKGRDKTAAAVSVLAARLINYSTLMHSAYLINRIYTAWPSLLRSSFFSLDPIHTEEFHPFLPIGAAVKAHLVYCIRVIVEFAQHKGEINLSLHRQSGG